MNERPSVERSGYEHLKQGIQPIVVCVGSSQEHVNDQTVDSTDTFLNRIDPKGEASEVDFFEETDRAGVISPVDSKNKFSRRYYDCIGTTGSGIDIETGQEISFLSHFTPFVFYPSDVPEKHRESVSKFLLDLREHLRELKRRCEPGTIDVANVGGESSLRNQEQYYETAISKLSEIVYEELGFHPLENAGPKAPTWNPHPEGDTIFYDTLGRKLYLIRHHDNDPAETARDASI